MSEWQDRHDAFTDDTPKVEDLLKYRDSIASIVSVVGKKPRVVRPNGAEFASEYYLPGMFVGWSEPDIHGNTKIERTMCCSASYKNMGEYAGKLLVLSADGKLTPDGQYYTKRNMYVFEWFNRQTVVNRVLSIETVASPRASATLMEGGDKKIITLDPQETINQQPDGVYQTFLNPFSEGLWTPANKDSLDELKRTTTDYGRALVLDCYRDLI